MTTLPDDRSTATSRSTAQYQHFFPGWGYILRRHLGGECRGVMANYLDASFPDAGISYQVLDCLLRQFTEFRKAELSASAVVLGVIPSILQLLSPTPAETATLALRRPVLALLLSASTASSSPLRPGQRVGEPAPPPHSDAPLPGLAVFPAAVSALEYVVAAAAAGNTAYRTYQLCVWTVCTFSPTQAFLPAVWHAAALFLHLLGWTATLVRFRGGRGRWLGSELTPSAWAGGFALEKRRGGPGYVLLAMESVMYVAVPMQIFYGTIILSSLVFVSVFDAVVLACWYALSTVLCRAVLVYEIAGMRQQ